MVVLGVVTVVCDCSDSAASALALELKLLNLLGIHVTFGKMHTDRWTLGCSDPLLFFCSRTSEVGFVDSKKTDCHAITTADC